VVWEGRHREVPPYPDQLHEGALDQHVTLPALYAVVAKVGGNAKVYTRQEYRKFICWYLVRNPVGTAGYRATTELNYVVLPFLR
jgi:hypothetical protein